MVITEITPDHDDLTTETIETEEPIMGDVIAEEHIAMVDEDETLQVNSCFISIFVRWKTKKNRNLVNELALFCSVCETARRVSYQWTY